MPRLIYPLDYVPGLAVFTCGDCHSLATPAPSQPAFGKPVCAKWDRHLKTNADGQPLKCAECIVGARSDLND